jgi:hypothetical protein
MAPRQKLVDEDPEIHPHTHQRLPELDRTGHFVGHIHVLDNGPDDVWDVDEETGKVAGRHAATEAPEDPGGELELEAE